MAPPLLRAVKVGCLPIVVCDSCPLYAPTLASSVSMADYAILISEQAFLADPLKELQTALQLPETTMYRYLLITLLLLPVSAGTLQAAPDSDLWPRWETHDAQNQERIDHRGWAQVLRAYLYVDADGINRFAYDKVSEEDHSRLDRYIENMSQIPVSSLARANIGKLSIMTA